ncbi:MAG: outer membrane protein assembly factor [Kofleriaceae bacterium]
MMSVARLLPVAMIAIAIGAGCGGKTQRPRRPGEERLVAVRIEGNRAIDTEDLLGGLQLERSRQAGRALDQYQLELDTQRIRVAYQLKGFNEAVVTNRVDTKNDDVTVTFLVQEGPRARMRVEFRGLPPEVPESQARALIPIPDGGPFDYEVYDAAKLTLQQVVEAAGYADVEISATVNVDRTKDEAVAVYDVDPGPPSTFGQVDITGANGQLADAIRGRVTFRAGERYSPLAIAETERSIYELARFASVRLEFEADDNGNVPVTIVVTPGTRHEFLVGFGAGYDSQDYELRSRIGYRQILEDAPLWSYAIDGRIALLFPSDDGRPDVWTTPGLRGRALVSVERVELMWPRVRGEVHVGVDYLTYEPFTTYGPRIGAGLTGVLGVSWLRGRAGWELYAPGYLDISAAVDGATQARLGIEDGFNVDRRVGMVTQSVSADLRDDALSPRLGAFLQLRVSEGSPYAGGGLEFFQIEPDVRLYAPLGPMVLAAHARYGGIYGDVPANERYYSGGSSSHRGFATRQLSPFATSADGMTRVVIGGAALVETGAELRIPVAEPAGYPFEIAPFLDLGDVTETHAQLDLYHLHAATGLSFRWKPGIALRLDVAYRLNRKGPTDPQYEAGGAWERLSDLKLPADVQVGIGIGDPF